MPYQDFVNGLRELGYGVEERGANRVTFPFRIETGKFAGKEIEIGYEVPGDFNLQAPSGPHIKPQLLPITNGGGTHPTGGVHPSPFGPEWEYWSRPINHWANTKRTVKDVIAHLKKLFDTQ
jgi:hypothetical protein